MSALGQRRQDEPFWGDVHNHNEIGYGKGSIDRSYAIAKGSGLDVYAFTPHGYWHDPPREDRTVLEQHQAAFAAVAGKWDAVRQRANLENLPGAFVAFVAVEWHSSAFGDYHILFPADHGEVCRATTANDAQTFARGYGAIMIPHHIAYRRGWRGTNWDEFRADVSPVVDVFSEHGNGLEPETHWPYTLHSMGGADRSQTFMARLERGLIAGVVASTDNHVGHPASFGERLAGIWAESLDRENVLDAIRKRHTYAVTGDRIGLRVGMSGGVMGDILPPETPRRLEYTVDAVGGIDYVKIIKNGVVVHVDTPRPSIPGRTSGYLARIEFGWDGMRSRDTTEWTVRVSVDGGVIVQVIPCFAGGPGSYDSINRVTAVAPSETMFEAYTSRLNPRPTSSVVVRLEGDLAARITVDVAARHRGRCCGCVLDGSLGQLARETGWGAIDSMFSAPKIGLGVVPPEEPTRLTGQWTDPAPGGDDFYLVKVQQKNGQIAWGSPIWCASR